jgi:hypothetical protein
MVGYFLPQTCGGAFSVKTTRGATVWTSHAKYFECGECEARHSDTAKQLTEVDLQKILTRETP